MLTGLVLIQTSLWLVIVGWCAWAIRRVSRGAIFGEQLARAWARGTVDELQRGLGRLGAPYGGLGEVLHVSDEGSAWIMLREQEIMLTRYYLDAVASLRALGLTASALGFVSIALVISGAHDGASPEAAGLVSAGGLAAERASTAFALAFAGSGTAIAIGGALRREARAALSGLAALVDCVEGALEAREREGSASRSDEREPDVDAPPTARDAGPSDGDDDSVRELSLAPDV